MALARRSGTQDDRLRRAYTCRTELARVSGAERCVRFMQVRNLGYSECELDTTRLDWNEKVTDMREQKRPKCNGRQAGIGTMR